MHCSRCGAPLATDSAFCNKCGAPTRPGAAAPLAPPPPAAAEPEEEVWTGRYSGKAVAHWWIFWFLWTVGLSYLYAMVLKERPPYALYVYLGLIAAPALAILWHIAIRKLTLKYRLTSHRFFRESGFISRDIAELELIRVDDVSVRQNILQRIFNVGAVTILSSDATDPRLLVEGIHDPIRAKELIRNHAQNRRKGAVRFDQV